MGTLDKSCDLGVTNCVNSGAISVLHGSKLERNLSALIKLATICPQSGEVIFMSEINHFLFI